MKASEMKLHMERLFYADTNVVIILGGTNDLIRKVPGATFAADVIELHETAKRLMREQGTSNPHTVAITVPSTHNPIYEEERRAANKIIRRYAADNADSTLLFDMEDIWPLVERTEEGQEEDEHANENWSPDKTHFSTHGYEKMGFELYEILKLHLLSSSNKKIAESKENGDDSR